MTGVQTLTHEFVEYVPRELKDGVLYVSIPFATVIHKCCCGCGMQVVTPLAPSQWSLTFDGKSISLDPSIGNWNFPCKSHYWIRRNQVEWAKKWTKAEIAAGQHGDARAIEEQFTPNRHAAKDTIATTNVKAAPRKKSMLAKLKGLFGK